MSDATTSLPATEPVIAHLGIVLVDVQAPFLRSLPPETADRLLRRCRFVAKVAQCFALPLAITEQIPAKLGATDPQLLEAVDPATPRFPKTAFSALGDGTLDAWLEQHEIDHLLIAGLETTICVYASAVDALGRDLGVTVLSDVVAARQEAENSNVFAALRHAGAHVLPAETVFYSLLGTAAHPRFRAFTSLVKAFPDAATTTTATNQTKP